MVAEGRWAERGDGEGGSESEGGADSVGVARVGAGHRVEKKEQKSTCIEHPVGVKLWPRTPSPHPDNSASRVVHRPHL